MVRFMCRVFLAWIGAAAMAFAQTDAAHISSPDGRIEFQLLQVQPPGRGQQPSRLAYEVKFRGKPLIDASFLGLQIEGQGLLGADMKRVSLSPGALEETYTLPVGKSKEVRNHYTSLDVEYQENGGQGRRLKVEARAYDDGVAFRYVVPGTGSMQAIRIVNEATQFRFAKDAESYPLILRNFRTSYEDQYNRITLSGIHPDSLIALPFLVQQPGVGWVAVTEADIDNYAGMYLTHPTGTTMETKLAPRVDDPDIAVAGSAPLTTPWRVLLIGAEPGRLIESNMILNLNPPSKIADTSWIKAGKTAWDWWSGTFAEGVSFQPGMNTETMDHYIDFAAESGLQYMLIDAGWTARTQSRDLADLTQVRPELDMPEILQHAKSKGVGIWLWANWFSVDAQMEEAFTQFEKWGVAGVKIDYMDRDDQWMVNFYRRTVEAAARHHLMVDFHGAFKPDGFRRTYPNLMTREGVMGLEYLKWSARTTPEHDVMLAFTRMLAGPMDYTPGGFNNVTAAEFQPRNRQPMVMGTRAHQLALYVVFESPLMMVSDYPEAYAGQRDFDFIKEVPASWDETKVLNGEVGEYVTVARKSGNDWYLGSITNWTPRVLDVPLAFLGPGNFVAEVYGDAADADVNAKHTSIGQQNVNAKTTLQLTLAPGGGAAVRIRPAD